VIRFSESRLFQLELATFRLARASCLVVEADERRLEPVVPSAVQRGTRPNVMFLYRVPSIRVDAGEIEAGLADGLPSRRRVVTWCVVLSRCSCGWCAWRMGQ